MQHHIKTKVLGGGLKVNVAMDTFTIVLRLLGVRVNHVYKLGSRELRLERVPNVRHTSRTVSIQSTGILCRWQ
jgi:hypothetical protein